MSAPYFAFGEMLWDCLPSGRHAGGAPFNVAAHLAQLGVPASLISAVGQDPLGDQILQVARDKCVDARFVARARVGLATGTVRATLDASSNATYEIVQPAAWDEIAVPPEALAAVAGAQAFIFGSLSARSPHNLAQLDRLLATPGPTKFFDVNLRPPFVHPAQVMSLARRADVLKLNDDEVGMLATWAQTGEMMKNTPRTTDGVSIACQALSAITGVRRICVTRGAVGAAMWDGTRLVSVPAPPVEVRDTVGAGDAFMAGMVVGVTRGAETRVALERACRLGAFVASHHGATPLFPAELIEEFRVA